MPIISNAEYHRLKAAEKRLSEIEDQRAAGPFTERLVQSIGMLVAHTKTSEWPNMVLRAYESVAREIPTGAAAYSRLRGKLADAAPELLLNGKVPR